MDNTDNFRADATSGASGGNIGVSVSVGVNDVSNNTNASVGDSAALAAPKVTISGGWRGQCNGVELRTELCPSASLRGRRQWQ